MIPRRKAHTLKGELSLCVKSMLSRSRAIPFYKDRWRDKFANFIDVKHAISVSSGREGMRLILGSLGLNANDEVIMPAYTLKELAGIIESLGLKAVSADIDPHTFNISPESIAKRINKKTKVILATHIFGVPCRIDEVLDIARVRSIFVIEDCAHSLGSKFKGRQTGSFGDAAFFSFETIKLVNTYGGGMVVTNNDKIAGRILDAVSIVQEKSRLPLKKLIMTRLENYLLPTSFSLPILYLLASSYWHKRAYSFYRRLQGSLGVKGSWSDFQAFIGIEKLGTLEERVSRRRAQAALLSSLVNNKIKTQQVPEGSIPNYYFFVCLVPDNLWQVRKFLLMHGIDAGIESEIADDCCNYSGANSCPHAAEVFKSAMQIPLHEGMSEPDIRYVAAMLNKFFS